MSLKIIRNDLTTMKVDAIVNPTNERFDAQGGLDALIHEKAGPSLKKACAKIGKCECGKACISKAYQLPCKYIIHTVGPIYNPNMNQEALLRSCYENCFAYVEKYKIKSIALPLISAGTYGYPYQDVIKIASDVIKNYLMTHDLEVYLVVYNKEAFIYTQQKYHDIQSFIDDHYVESHQMIRNRKVIAKKSQSLSDEFNAYPMIETAKCAGLINNLDDLDQQIDESFMEMLFRKIDEKGMSDVECYKKANIDRKHFSKMKANMHYQPSKHTAIAFAIALQLDLEECKELLLKAGYALSRSYKFDLIIEYFITNKQYDLFEINEVLFMYDQKLLGV